MASYSWGRSFFCERKVKGERLASKRCQAVKEEGDVIALGSREKACDTVATVCAAQI